MNKMYNSCLHFFCFPYIFLPKIHNSVSTNSQNINHCSPMLILYTSSSYLCVGFSQYLLYVNRLLDMMEAKVTMLEKNLFSSLHNNKFGYYSRT